MELRYHHQAGSEVCLITVSLCEVGIRRDHSVDGSLIGPGNKLWDPPVPVYESPAELEV